MKTKNEKQHPNFLTENTDFEVRSLDAVCVNESELKHLPQGRDWRWWYNLKYLSAVYFLESYW